MRGALGEEQLCSPTCLLPAPGVGGGGPRRQRQLLHGKEEDGSSGQSHTRPVILLPPMPEPWAGGGSGGVCVCGCALMALRTPTYRMSYQDFLATSPSWKSQRDTRHGLWGLQELLAHHLLRGQLAEGQHCRGLQTTWSGLCEVRWNFGAGNG